MGFPYQGCTGGGANGAAGAASIDSDITSATGAVTGAGILLDPPPPTRILRLLGLAITVPGGALYDGWVMSIPEHFQMYM